MAVMKTPGVYIVEKSAFPNSVVQVATAVPAFIGYTEKALNGKKSLHMTPRRISSMAEYITHFGGQAQPVYQIKPLNDQDDDDLPTAQYDADGRKFALRQTNPAFCLFGAMRQFFQNGGGPCYIVSIGAYTVLKEGSEDEYEDNVIDPDKMKDGIKKLKKEQEPTMVVIPETTRLDADNSISVQQAMLNHCGNVMKNRFAILDIHKGHLELDDEKGEPVKEFRSALGINFLDYGAAYYPWVNTTIFQSRDFTFDNIDDASKVQFIEQMRGSLEAPTDDAKAEIGFVNSPQLMKPGAQVPAGASTPADVKFELEKPDTVIKADSLAIIDPVDPDQTFDADKNTLTIKNEGKWTADKAKNTVTFKPVATFKGTSTIQLQLATAPKPETGAPAAGDFKPVKLSQSAAIPGPTKENVDKTLRAICPLYVEVMDAIALRENAMSPGATMAGVYTMVDNNRGVWKAPANVSVNSVSSPMVNVSHEDQEDLNVSTTGKSINAIRPFVGEGTLVWGARTLDGNSLDWRYINVRRTMIMIEESIRLASKAYVFEPNVANTWVTIRSMIENFLNGIWKQGGLAGAVPEDAFSVHVGLGETMTPEDILEGILCVTVLVAVSRPAEFIEVTFQQQMQKS